MQVAPEPAFLAQLPGRVSPPVPGAARFGVEAPGALLRGLGFEVHAALRCLRPRRPRQASDQPRSQGVAFSSFPNGGRRVSCYEFQADLLLCSGLPSFSF